MFIIIIFYLISCILLASFFIICEYKEISSKLDVLKIFISMFCWPYFLFSVLYLNIKEALLAFWNLPLK